jgi:hypothetical protein
VSGLTILDLAELRRTILLLPVIQGRPADVHALADGFRCFTSLWPEQDCDHLLRRAFLFFWHVWISFLEPDFSFVMTQISKVKSDCANVFFGTWGSYFGLWFNDLPGPIFGDNFSQLRVHSSIERR